MNHSICSINQGGQWTDVFIDMGGIPPEALGIDFYRWLYTAVTRTTTRLHLLNPSRQSKITQLSINVFH